MSDTTLTMKIEQITVNGNVRKDLRLDDEFVASIREHGIIQPLIINDGVLVAGHRRLAAASILELPEVPVVLMDLAPEDVRAIQLVENVHRNDLTPLELAQAMWDMKVDDDLTQPMIEDATGMNRKVISELQKIGKAFASDEHMNERLDGLANQLTIESLVDLATIDSDAAEMSEVLRVMFESFDDDGNVLGISRAFNQAVGNKETVEFMDQLTPDLKAWSEAGIEVTYTDPTIIPGQDTGEYGYKKRDAKYKQLGAYGAIIDVADHMALECHVTQVSISDGTYGSHNGVTHWCKNFNLHREKGKSPLKHESAKTEQEQKEVNSANNLEVRDARKLRVEQATDWFNGGKVARKVTTEMALIEAADLMAYDDYKIVGRDILVLDKPTEVKGMDANSWYRANVITWVEDKAGDDPIAKAHIMVALRMALAHVKETGPRMYSWRQEYRSLITG